MTFRQYSQTPSEIIIGIIGPIGCNRKLVIETFEKLAKHYSYRTKIIGLSGLIEQHCTIPKHHDDQFTRVSNLMTAGSELRGRTKDNSILAKLAAAEINKERKKEKDARIIYIVDSLKHPDEVDELRNIYGLGFYLFAVHSAQKNRELFLKNQCSIHDKKREMR